MVAICNYIRNVLIVKFTHVGIYTNMKIFAVIVAHYLSKILAVAKFMCTATLLYL